MLTSAPGSKARRKLLPSGPARCTAGYLLFVRGSLMAHAFDTRARQRRVSRWPWPKSGPHQEAPRPIFFLLGFSDGCPRLRQRAENLGSAPLDRSRRSRTRRVRGAWRCADPALSPDGRRLAVCRDDHKQRNRTSGSSTSCAGASPLHVHPRSEVYPVWSPDGARIAFSFDRTIPQQLYVSPRPPGTRRGARRRTTLIRGLVVGGLPRLFRWARPCHSTDIWMLPLDASGGLNLWCRAPSETGPAVA
jgi:hypothetical protein